MSTIRKLINSDSDVIDITSVIAQLRRHQYHNTLKELHQELSVLVTLPNIASEIKSKITKSLKGVSQLLESIEKKKDY